MGCQGRGKPELPRRPPAPWSGRGGSPEGRRSRRAVDPVERPGVAGAGRVMDDPLAPEAWIGVCWDGGRGVYRTQGQSIKTACFRAIVDTYRAGHAVKELVLTDADWARMVAKHPEMRVDGIGQVTFFGPTGPVRVYATRGRPQ